MANIEIYFCGLICHMGPSIEEGSDRTTLVKSVLLDDGGDHVPRVLMSFKKPSGWLGDILYTNVTFTGFSGEAKATPLFLDSVVHLDDLTRAGTKGHSNPKGYSAIVPGGQFFVVEFYRVGALWTIDEDDVYIRQCVPRVTMLTATSQNSSTIHFNKESVPLDQNGWILITNLEMEKQRQPGEDWKKQHAATTGKVDDIAKYGMLDDPGAPCSTCKKKKPADGVYKTTVLKILANPKLVDTSECTNSHWP